MKKTLFLITSVINYKVKPLSYSGTRSIYTVEDRIIHTQKTIDSIRSKVKNAHILLLELGKYDNNINSLKRLDELKFLGNNFIVRLAVDSIHKGFGEAIGLLFGIFSLKRNNFDYLFKLSGRYFLNRNFKINNWNNKSISTKVYENSISTRLYGMPINMLPYLKKSLILSLPSLLKGKSIEECLFYYLSKKINQMDELGVSGYVAVDGSLIEE